MSYFLWIEDFENSAKVTANDVFGSIFDDSYFAEDKRKLKNELKQHGIFIELSFQNGLSFVRNHLNKIDYIILDIDLIAYSKTDEINNDVLQLLKTFQDYQEIADGTENEALLKKECDNLKEIAGFYLYTELVVELGFPKKHILFCSNHGENTKRIQEAFKFAKIDLPKIREKSNPEVQNWVKERYENPYSRLRRGIIEGCKYVKNKYANISINDLPFNKTINKPDKKFTFDDIIDYINVLESFLPLQKPTDENKLYKLFIRTLTHEWEAAEPKQLSNKRDEFYAFASIMKITRNWIAHNSTAIFNHLNEQDVAYLFICNMRAIFNLGHKVKNYEEILFPLFSYTGVDFDMNKIPFVENYIKLFNELSKNKEHNHVDEILNTLQNDKQKIQEKGNAFFITGLYQLFWFLTASEENTGNNTAQEHSTNLNQVIISRDYSFKTFDYAKTEFLKSFSQHIYSRSFPVAN